MIDPRGPRFAAWITTLVLAAVLLSGSAWLLATQAVVFALGATGSNPYALFWKHVLPRLGVKRTPPTELEPAAPLRFAQAVGLVFSGIALAAFAVGALTVALIATGAALAAAFLNAAFGICLGCEIYLRIRTATSTEGATA